MSFKKWKPCYDSNSKCTSKFEETFVWVRKDPDGSDAAFCNICKCTIIPKLNNLTRHEKTDKHKQKTMKKGQTTLTSLSLRG